MRVICISGTPGTGKTTLSKEMGEELGYPVLDVGKFIKEKGLSIEYDKKRQSDVVEIKELNEEIMKEVEAVQREKNPTGVIIDSHLSHYLPTDFVDLCIITKCDISVLKKRLEKRGYSKDKVRENLDSEIFDVCFSEAKERGHKVVTIDTSQNINMKKAINIIGDVLNE